MLEDAAALHEAFAVRPPTPGSIRAGLGSRIRRARVDRLGLTAVDGPPRR